MLAEDLDTDLVQVIEGIYDAVIEPQLWPDICDRMRHGFNFFNADMTVVDVHRGTAITNVAVNIPEEFLQLRTPPAMAEVVEMWGGADRVSKAALEEPVALSDSSDPATWMKYTYYREFAVPQGIVDSIAIPLVRDRGLLGNISFGRHKSVRRPPPRDFARLRVIAPHLRRAAIISGVLNDSMSAAATFSAALDATASGVVIVDDDLRILHANAVAQPMLAATDPILDVAGRLQLREELVPGQLTAAIRGASNEATLGRRGQGIPTRKRDGSPVVVTVMPLERRTLRGGVSSQAAAAVLISNSEPMRLPSDALSLLYDLTPAEVRVFELAVEGRSTSAAAAALGISPSTVKTHMQRVFDKTGLRHRVGLANLANKIKLP